MAYLSLPKKDKDLAVALDTAIQESESWLNMAYVEWFCIHHYLQGARRFWIEDYATGSVNVAYEGEDDELQFKYEEILRMFQTEKSIFMKMDIDPVASSEGFGVLDSVRSAGIAHSTLRYMLSGVNKERIKKNFIQMWVKFGTAGLIHYRIQGDTLRDRTGIDVVPPWEILGIPGEMHHEGDLRGLVRKRLVPLRWLEEGIGMKISAKDSKLRAEYFGYGEVPKQYGSLDAGGAGGFSGGSLGHSQGTKEYHESWASKEKDREGKKQSEAWVHLEEVWTFFSDNTVHEYIVKIGEHIEQRQTYEERDKVVCPLSVGRFIPTGRFYGRSYIGYQLGLNDQIEKMAGRLFQNISDFDEFGILTVPTNLGLNIADVRKRERRKVLQYEPDPLTPQLRPDSIQPVNSGDAPGRVLQLGVQLADKISGQGELYSGGAPGRVDSASGLGFLFETGNIGRIESSSELADVFQQLYRGLLQEARNEAGAAKQAGKPITFIVPVVDDRILGVSISEAGEISLDTNPIPNPFDVNIDVADRQPMSKVQMRQEAKELLQVGEMQSLEFRILNYRENLGFPIVDRSEWESYRKAIYKKILLFNDGKIPKKIVMSSVADHPEIELMVCQGLMSSIEFMLASPEVRTGFEQWKEETEKLLGRSFPDQMPYPEEQLAVEQGQGAGNDVMQQLLGMQRSPASNGASAVPQ